MRWMWPRSFVQNPWKTFPSKAKKEEMKATTATPHKDKKVFETIVYLLLGFADAQREMSQVELDALS